MYSRPLKSDDLEYNHEYNPLTNGILAYTKIITIVPVVTEETIRRQVSSPGGGHPLGQNLGVWYRESWHHGSPCIHSAVSRAVNLKDQM